MENGSNTCRLEPDSCGGAGVAGLSGACTISVPGLRALDIDASPGLTELDLSRCAAGLHLALRHCPALRRIRLPEEGGGAVIHLDAGESVPALTLTGAVDQVDACWAGGRFELNHPREAAPLRGVQIGDQPPAPEVEGWVGLRVQLPKATALPAHLRQIRLQAVTGAECLTVSAAARLEALEIAGAPDLTQVDVQRIGARLSLADCPRLAELTGEESAVSLDRCGEGGGLALRGFWRRLTLNNCRYGDVHAQVSSVIVQACPDVARLHLPAGVHAISLGKSFPAIHAPDAVQWHGAENGGVMPLLERAREATGAAQLESEGALLDWAWRERTPIQRLAALRALAAALEESDPLLLWKLRCLLHLALSRKKPRSRPELDEAFRAAGNRWNWRLGDDLWLEGRAADLQLYHAAQHLPEAAPFGELLRRLADSHDLHALAWYLRRIHDQGQRVNGNWMALLRAGLRRLARRRQHRSDRQVPALEAIIQLAARLRDRATADGIYRYADQHLPPEAAIPVLAALARKGHLQSRPRLMVLMQALGPDQATLRQQAGAAALAPARDPSFHLEPEEVPA